MSDRLTLRERGAAMIEAALRKHLGLPYEDVADPEGWGAVPIGEWPEEMARGLVAGLVKGALGAVPMLVDEAIRRELQRREVDDGPDWRRPLWEPYWKS